MVKAYFNYLFDRPVGQYTSSQCNIVSHGDFLYSACNQYICVIRIKSGQVQQYLYKPTKNVPIRHLNISLNTLYAGYEDGQIVAWNLSSHQTVMTLDAHQATVSDIRVLDDTMVSAGYDTQIVVWDLISQQCQTIKNAHKGAVVKLEIVQIRNKETEQKKLYILSLGRDSYLKLWELDGRGLVDLISTITEAETFVLDRNSKLVYVPTSRDEILIVKVGQFEDVDSGAKRYLEMVGKSKRNTFAKAKHVELRGNMLYLANSDKGLETYQILNQKELKSRKKVLMNRVKEKASEDAVETGLTKTDQQIRIKYIKTRVLPEKCQNFTFHHESMLINTGKNIYNLDSEAFVINNALGITTSLSLSHPYLCQQSHSKVKIYQAGNFNALYTLPLEVTHCTLFKSYALILSNKELIVWNLASNQEVARKEEPLGKKVWAGKHGVLVWGDNTLHFYSLGRDKRGSIHLNLAGEKFFTEKIIMCSYLDDIKYIVCTEDKIIQVLYSDSNKVFLSLYGHSLPITSYDTSTDHNMLVSGSVDKDIKLWNLDFGDVRKSIFAHSQAVTVVRFCKDTHFFFSGGQDGHLKYWDGDTGQLILDLEESTQMIRDIVISSAGDYVVAAGNDTGFRIWRQSQEQIFESEEREKRTEKVIVEDYTKSKLKNNLQKTTYEDLKHGEQIIECLQGHDKPSTLLNLLQKIPPNKLKACLSFLHGKHRAAIQKYLQFYVECDHSLELAWRVCDALNLQSKVLSVSLRSKWQKDNQTIRVNTEAINILLQSIREGRALQQV